MPQTIARIYASQEAANAAVTELRERGVKAQVIQAAGNPGIDAMIGAGVDRAHAMIYSEHIQHGETLVAVEPLFGRAGPAGHILESHKPVTIDLPAAEVPPYATWDWNSPTPLSTWMGWPVLLDDPTPLSTYVKQPVLKAEPATSKTQDQIRTQSLDSAPLSSKLGLPLLSENPAPLSTRFGWRLLLKRAAPLSEKFGWRILLDDAAPVSKKFGWPVLLDNPTPLSSALGWKILCRDR
jgi:hypothetical protein